MYFNELQSLSGDIWHCSSHCSQRCVEGGTVQPQGGAVRGDLDHHPWNFLYVFIMLSTQCNSCCLQPDMCLIGPIWCLCVKLYNQTIYLPSSTAFFLPTWVFTVGTKARDQPAGSVFVWWSTTTFIASKGQDTQSTGRERTVKLGWNGGGEQCRRAAACQVLWSGDPAPNPHHHHHQVPLPSCDVL